MLIDPEGPDGHEHVRRAEPGEGHDVRVCRGTTAPRPWRHTTSKVYAYDENGNVTRHHGERGRHRRLARRSSLTGRGYDTLDRITSDSQPLPDGGARPDQYTYYANGMRKTVTDPAGVVTQYTYDGQNRLKTATTSHGTPDAATTSYTYWPDGLLNEVTYPNTVKATHVYDKADRLRTVTNARGADRALELRLHL